jgi:uncharacterized repeat protein (TIGR02543 family)
MKKNLFNKFWLRVGMLVAVMTTALSGTAWAETTYKLQQVTSVEAGGLYVFEQSGHVMINTVTSKKLQTTNTYSATGLKGTETYIWTLEAVTGDASKYYMKNVSLSTSSYLNYSSDLTFSNNKTTSWLFSFQTDNTVIISISSNNRFLGYTSATSYEYKTYANSNLSSYPHAIKVYQLVEEGGDTPTPTTYTVTFNAGEGTFVANNDFPNASNDVAAGTYTLPSATRDGYTFDGWLTTGSTEPLTGNYTVSGNVDFTAQYSQNSSSSELTATLTSTNLELTGSYTTDTEKTVDDITYVYTDLMKNNNNIQAKASTGTIKNTTAYPGDITSVVITHSGTARATTINGSADGENWTQVATGSGSITADFSGKGYKYFQITRGSNAAYWTKIEITYSATSSSQDPSDLTITNASTDLTFDLYNNSAAQVISYTTSSTGAITIEPASPTSSFSYVHDAVAKTITVTPLAVTTSAQTVTISQAADENYYAGEATFTVSVTNNDPNVPGTENNPYTVAQARAAIDAGTGVTGVYATGIVTAIPTAWSTQHNNITFNFVDTAGDESFLQAYRCASGQGVDASTVAVGDIVVVYGNLTKFSETYEFGQGCTLVSLTHPVVAVEAPTFSLASGIFSEAQTVTISCATSGASIYYTTDGSDPTDASTEYTGPITVSTTMTIKAIAIKGADQSAIASATYTIFVLEDGVFNFAAKMSDYGSGITTTSLSNDYVTEASTWTAGNVTLVASGKYRWWDNGGELRFYNNDPQSKMTISVPSGYVITEIVVTGGTGFEADCGSYTSGTWTGSSQTVVLTYAASSSQNVKTVTVTYAPAVTVGDALYTTYVAPADVTFPEGLTAYIVPSKTATSVTLTEVTAVPAGTPVIVNATAAGTYPLTVSDTTPTVGTNLLLASDGTVTGGTGIYALAKKGEPAVVGFYPVDESVTIPAGKAYLNTGVTVKGYVFDFEDDATSIQTIENGQLTTDGVIYNLAGQRLQKMQKGINIVNGKKILK